MGSLLPILVVYSTVQYVYHVYLFSAYDPSLFDIRFTLYIPAEWGTGDPISALCYTR
jgi:hypothetical protein